MKEIIFNRRDYKSYQDFYEDVAIKLERERFPDWQDDEYKRLCCSGDTLDEFLWYCHNDNLHIVFVNFDKERIKLQRNFDDYKYNIVIEVFERFAKQYPNNKVEFKMDKAKK